MRMIRKQGNGSRHLQRAHANQPNSSSDATTRWRSFRHKAKVKKLLLGEQYYLCCYSELRADEEKLGYHIEHIENKSQNPNRTFDYTNLAASALSSDDLKDVKIMQKNVFGGHAQVKSGQNGAVDMSLFISPHQNGCSRYFTYLSDGRVIPSSGLEKKEKSQAEYTIDALNLNCPFLVTRRFQWWNELEDLEKEYSEKGWSLSDLIATNLLPINGKMYRFFSITRQFFGEKAENVLKQQAPELL